jgi:hypothetical protein
MTGGDYMRRVVASALVLVMLAACASIDTLMASRGKGVKRTFRFGYDDVYVVALEAAGKRKLEIVDTTTSKGTLLLSNGASWSSLGERIAVFVVQLNDKTTSVEIVSRPVVPTVTFPPDWAELLLSDIEELLAVRRLSR